MTLYLQDVLRFGPLATGPIFGVPGLASAAASRASGSIAGPGRPHRATDPLGTEASWLWLLIPAVFVGFLGHITAVVAATVLATSEVADADAGLATGLFVHRGEPRLPARNYPGSYPQRGPKRLKRGDGLPVQIQP
jgi:hypothetical protein